MTSACVCQEAALAAYPVSPRMWGSARHVCTYYLVQYSKSQDAKRKLLAIADFFIRK